MIVTVNGKRYYDKSSAARYLRKNRVAFGLHCEPLLQAVINKEVPGLQGYKRTLYPEETLQNFSGPEIVPEDNK